ncbi:MAG: 50S ribosomal protein L11 methyltransferase [Xanthomonadales bacterium]|nr:50S ribosomal protein L11 methyltransferase [Xanthomonadales bacterium]
MSWTEVCISVTRRSTAVAELAMEQLGALAVTLQDDEDHPVLEPGPGETPLWPAVHVRGLFAAGVDRQRVLAALQTVPGAERPGNIRWREVGDQDWVRAWMDRFKPMQFGRRLWIVPSGMSIPFEPENIEIHLDPGLAFGTGTHPTTALCLEWLDGQDVAGLQVVDYGCGSGILAIAASLKGARRVYCVDNDPQALEASASNAARNRVGGVIRCLAPAGFTAQGSDVVLANILAGPLIELAPVISGCARSGARIVLSGLLEEQVEEVLAAYLPACQRSEVSTRDGWARVVLLKN